MLGRPDMAPRRCLVLFALLRCAAAVPLTPPSTPPPGYRGRRPFTGSPFFSLGHTRPLPVSPPLDLGDPAQLAAALSARAFKGELLFWTFDAAPDCTNTCSGIPRSWLEQAVGSARMPAAPGTLRCRACTDAGRVRCRAQWWRR